MFGLSKKQTRDTLMTILVTGATGNIGSQVIQRLVDRGADVRDRSRVDFPARRQGRLPRCRLPAHSLRRRVDTVSTERRRARRIYLGFGRTQCRSLGGR